MTFLTKAGLIQKTAPKTYRITESGKAFLKKHPGNFVERDLKEIPGYREAWQPKGKNEPGEVPSAFTPEESINSALNVMLEDVRNRLLEANLRGLGSYTELIVTYPPWRSWLFFG